MVLLERETEQKILRVLKIGGFIVLLGIFIGITLGVYTLFNPPLFLILINISQHEATLFFLGVYLPSFVIIVALGYVFVTTQKIKKFNLWRTFALSILILLCLILSALSIFNFLSFFGGFLVLTAVILAHTKPTFKALWKREACFLVETGTVLIASSSLLFLLIWSISGFLQTYSSGIYETNYSYPYILLVMGSLSLFTFFMAPLLCLHRTNKGLCGILSLTMSILAFITIIQNQYIYFNLSAYQGIFLAIIGTILTFCGGLICIKLSLSEAIFSTAPGLSFLYWGKHCPYCGESWVNFKKDVCSSCGRSLNLKSEISFCPHCGRLVTQNAGDCPHCMEDIGSLPVYISLSKLRGEGFIMKRGKLGKLQKTLGVLSKHIAGILGRIQLPLKESVYIGILTFLITFLSFIGYIRTEPAAAQGCFVYHYGFPLEWLEVPFSVQIPFLYYIMRGGVRIIWIALILDFTFYFLLAFIVVHGIAKLKSRYAFLES